MSDLTPEPLGAGRVETRELDQEVRTSFLDYAMSVIVSRALPDVRDALKPVHRRVLFAMHEAGLQPNRPTRKSARVVGDVMGNYHPHGDSAIYDTLVRMTQPFSLRYPRIDGQGYFGTIVGRSGIKDAYRSARGRIVVRGRAHIEQLRGGKSAIIITELPWGVRKAGEGGVIEKIADIVKSGTLNEVPMSDDALQDHSDKEGMRIYVELKRDAVPQVALNKLFKLTPLQTTFGYNAVALVDGVPRTLSLLELIRYSLDC